jgi:PmbA protein
MVAVRDDVDELLSAALEASDAEQTEVLYMANDEALTRFATNQIHQNVREHDATVQVRVIDGQRVGVAGTNRLDRGGLRDVVSKAAAIARRSAPNEKAGDLPEPDGRPEPTAGLGYVATTADATPEQRGAGARAVIAAGEAQRLQVAGAFATGVVTLAVANSRGLRARSQTTRANLITVMMDGFASGAASGYANASSPDVDEIDAESTGREAAAKGSDMRGAEALEPGEYEVVLEEYAVAGLLEYLAFIGFSALALEEGRSFMELGTRVMGENVSIWDDGQDPSGLPGPIDFEGVARQRVELIRAGIANAVVHDAATAGRFGTRSTGHALPAPNVYGPTALNLFMAAGDATRESMLGGISRGVWVTRFHYINPLHPKKAILTGMTKDGTFLIENGKLTRPVLNFRFTQSIPEAFSDVRGIGASTKLLAGEFLGGYRVPVLRLGSFNFTGATAAEGAGAEG